MLICINFLSLVEWAIGTHLLFTSLCKQWKQVSQWKPKKVKYQSIETIPADFSNLDQSASVPIPNLSMKSLPNFTLTPITTSPWPTICQAYRFHFIAPIPPLLRLLGFPSLWSLCDSDRANDNLADHMTKVLVNSFILSLIIGSKRIVPLKSLLGLAQREKKNLQEPSRKRHVP